MKLIKIERPKVRIKRVINKMLGLVNLAIVSEKRVGVSIYNEIRRTKMDIDVVFDVGANVGQSSIEYLREFPRAEVHAFEPIGANFKALILNDDPRLTPNYCAVGKEIGTVKIFLSNHPTKHSSVIVEDEGNYEFVEVITIDDYCADKGVKNIGLLKVDTEGADLGVLKGAQRLLDKKAIDFILVETAFYEKQRHVHLCDFLGYLSPKGYDVVGVYDQTLEWDGRARIRYANLLFARNGIMMSK